MKAGESRVCQICGKSFEIIDKGWTRKYCYECSPKVNKGDAHGVNLAIKRRAIKDMLIAYKGGKCERCGYNKCNRALEFHHLDPSIKEFGISTNINRNLDELKAEVDKCILLCSNCHAEVHDELERQ